MQIYLLISEFRLYASLPLRFAYKRVFVYMQLGYMQAILPVPSTCIYPSSTVEEMQESLPQDTESGINSIDQPNKDVKCTMIVQGQEVAFQIDTGSSVNMIPAKYARNIEPTDKIMKMWNNTRMKPVGKTTENLTNPKNNEVYKVDFIVFEDNLTPLLGLQTSLEMGLVDIRKENFVQVAQLHPLPVHDEDQDVFDGTLRKF